MVGFVLGLHVIDQRDVKITTSFDRGAILLQVTAGGFFQCFVQVTHGAKWAVGWAMLVVPRECKDAQTLVKVRHARVAHECTFDKGGTDTFASGDHVTMKEF